MTLAPSAAKDRGLWCWPLRFSVLIASSPLSPPPIPVSLSLSLNPICYFTRGATMIVIRVYIVHQRVVPDLYCVVVILLFDCRIRLTVVASGALIENGGEGWYLRHLILLSDLPWIPYAATKSAACAVPPTMAARCHVDFGSVQRVTGI